MGNKIIWFTGLSGARKTTITMAAANRFGYEVREADDIPPEVFEVSATGVRGGNHANVSIRVMEFMIQEGIWDGE